VIPAHLIDAVARHARAGRPAALVVRHAEREPVHDLRNHEAARLTLRGHAQARKAGALLARASSYVRVHHSPVERCGETARGLVDGVRSAGARAELICEVSALASPFVLDTERMLQLAAGVETFPRFLREWFDGKLPIDVLMPRRDAAHAQLAAVLEHLDDSGTLRTDALHIFVSHDWNILLVREEILGHRLEESWPHYLDGFAFSVDGDDMVIEAGERSSRRARPRDL
jgi:broad specificity phosphatase PhoE